MVGPWWGKGHYTATSPGTNPYSYNTIPFTLLVLYGYTWTMKL